MCGNHPTTTFFFIRYSVKMWCIIVFRIGDTPSTSCTIICLSLSRNMDTIATEVLSIVVKKQPVHTSSSVNLLPSFNCLNYRATVQQFTASWLLASCKLAVIIGTALFLKHSILIYASQTARITNVTFLNCHELQKLKIISIL